MLSPTMILIAIGVLVLFIVIYIIKVFNELTKEKILTEEATAGIGAGLQQRNDLIPNLVLTVKGYAAHEKNTLEEVTRWRNQSAAATTVEQQNLAERGLNQAISNLLVVSEAYPNLKADNNFRELMNELSRIEDKLNDARRYYNGTVREYNQDIAVFPKNLVATGFGFKSIPFFAEEAQARILPTVKF